jgi:magnesium transporter
MGLTRCYRDGRVIDEGFPVAEVSDHLAEPDTIVWFDLCEPTEDDLASISEELGLHKLAVEDAIHPHQRPKLDHYASHLFLTAYSVDLNNATGELDIHEVAAFVLPRALVTVRKSESFDIKAVVERWDSADPEMAGRGVGWLLHGLLDYVVDTQFDAIQSLDSDLEALEDSLFSDNVRDAAMQRRTYELRKSLVMLRRVVSPMREVVNTLMRRDLHIIDAETMPYFQDVYDHVLRAGEWTDSLRELIGNVYETHLTVRGNRLNVVMKQVTSWAAIIAVPTAITGFYGQNVPYPGFGQAWGFWVSTAVTAGLAVILYIAFRRKGWL